MAKLKFSSLLHRIPTSQTVWLGTVSVLVGLATGLGVWLFKQAFSLLASGMAGAFKPLQSMAGPWVLIFIPLIGGVVVGLISHFFVKEERGHGVASIMESVALAGGRLRYQRLPVKAAVSAISIGAGASVGPEDPSVQIGANLGSMFAQLLRMPDDRIRTLVAAGSAAAIAAAFNAPIAGVFFALELVLGEITGNSLGMVLVAAVSSSVFTQAVSGPEPAFHIPSYAFNSAAELPLYLALGLLAGPVSALYIRTIYWMQDFFRGLRLAGWIKTTVTGLVLGIVGLFLPQVLGVGYGTIQEILNQNDLSFWILFALLIAKLVLTPLSLGGGFRGGVFAPSLYLGAALGGAFGMASSAIFPGLPINPSAFALVGMAAVLAGTVHAPLTATILLFEMTSDYRIILPVMFAVAVSLLVSERLHRDSVYMTGLARHGVRLDRGRDVEVLQTISVEEAMQTDTRALVESAKLLEAAEALAQTRHHGLPVIDDAGNLIGILTVEDIERVDPAQRESMTVGGACTRELLVAYPHESLSVALRRMGHRDVGRLPVVDRNFPRRLVGVLRRSDIIRAYDLALTRRTTQRHQAQELMLDAITPESVNISEVSVERNSACAGQKMCDVDWPGQCLVASIRRGSQVFIPHGDTLIQVGDLLVVVAEQPAREAVLRLCRSMGYPQAAMKKDLPGQE
jgi:CIC family chloride channel protein